MGQKMENTMLNNHERLFSSKSCDMTPHENSYKFHCHTYIMKTF